MLQANSLGRVTMDLGCSNRESCHTFKIYGNVGAGANAGPNQAL